MDGIRMVAKTLLHLDVIKNPEFPFIAHHPFTTSPVTFLQTAEGGKPLNLEDESDAAEWRASVSKQIDCCSNPIQVYLMISSNYQTGFLMLAEPYLGTKDLPTIVRAVWQNAEDVNAGVNVSRSDFVSLFKECDKTALMNEDELEQYNELPDEVTVYRGVSSGKKKSARSLSWTTNKAMAEKLARRRGQGKTKAKVFSTRIPKSAILAYFDGESEVLVDPSAIKEIEECQPA